MGSCAVAWPASERRNVDRRVREYLVAVGAFLARTLTASGYPRDQLDRTLRRRLLAWALLHRYANLSWWMRRLPEPDRPTLDALADRWFATE